MRRKYVVYQKPWNERNSVQCDQKILRPVDTTYKIFYQVWGQSHDQYAQKWPETKCITDEGMNICQFKAILWCE